MLGAAGDDRDVRATQSDSGADDVLATVWHSGDDDVHAQHDALLSRLISGGDLPGSITMDTGRHTSNHQS